MKLDVTRTQVWAAGVKDEPGALAEKLEALHQAGANLEYALARRAPEEPGQGVVVVTPLKGAAQLRAARAMGFVRGDDLYFVRVAGAETPGAAAVITAALAKSGVNLRGLSATSIGKRFVAHLALDSAADATKTIRILKKLT
ncbi:MAG: amino acid-binding protein [Lentisphaerae bacterium]|nr:amino acid-binding protein [Lentisphaerota bacterium]